MIARMRRELPPGFLDGIDEITVTGRTIPHPLRRGVYTLGECVPQLETGETGQPLHSRILLHYGSFAALAREAPGFPWQQEAWDTLTHEIRHHLEWRARVPALEALDDAVEANYERVEGRPFAPLFFLDGEKIGDGVYKVEDDVFIDRLRGKTSPGDVTCAWHGRSWMVPLKPDLPDILFVTLEGLEPAPDGHVVLVIRRRPGARDLWHRAVVGRDTARVTPAPAP